ncbi:MAG: hypothetical protein KJO22_00595 [Bacteroidia bacterium]|nr:hypothetical protein [Bacteroidia bacterium]
MNEYIITRVITTAEEVSVLASNKEEAEANIRKFADGMEWVQLNSNATYDVEVA